MLQSLQLKNFTCFANATFTFSNGLNVLIGENGTGKSHLLKLGYALLRSIKNLRKAPAKDAYGRDIAAHLIALFRPDTLGRLASRTQGSTRCEIAARVQDCADLVASFSTKSSDMLTVDTCTFVAPLPAKPLFIPPKELLSVFPGFALTLENRELAFDETYLDICKNLAGVPLKGQRLDAMKHLLNQLKELLEGDICLENNRFYLLSSQGRGKFEAPLMAEGSRKLAMLLYLIKTGEMAPGCTLFWDEPEANLNPRFLQKLAVMLAELSHTIQIFIATHSLFLLRELDILQSQNILQKNRYFGLNFTQSTYFVEVFQGDCIDAIDEIVALDESLLQSQRYRTSQYGEQHENIYH